VGVFLNRSDWEADFLLAAQALRLLSRLGPQPGEVLYLLIDDTRIAKRGKRMAHLSKIWDHAKQRFVRGHLVVTAAWYFRGVVLPWRFDLWKPKATAGAGYRKTTELAARLIREMPLVVEGLKVRVLFDAFYLCPATAGACRDRGFTWFSVAASNRTLRTASGRQGKLRDLTPGLLRHHGRWVRLRRHRGWAWMRLASVTGHLSRIGEVRLAVSKRPRDPWKKVLVVATNELGLDGRAVRAAYEQRWWIEVLFKELKGTLGLGAYQVLQERGIVNHLHLCGLAHLMLTHHGHSAGGAQAKPTKKECVLPPLNSRLGHLRAAVRREQEETVIKRTRHKKVREKLRKLIAVLESAA
jgi:SRSO17 transposase